MQQLAGLLKEGLSAYDAIFELSRHISTSSDIRSVSAKQDILYQLKDLNTLVDQYTDSQGYNDTQDPADLDEMIVDTFQSLAEDLMQTAVADKEMYAKMLGDLKNSLKREGVEGIEELEDIDYRDYINYDEEGEESMMDDDY